MSSNCKHFNFAVLADFVRIADTPDAEVTGYAADIHVQCADCGEPFLWKGLPLGVDPERPTASVDGKTLRAPIRPQSSHPGFGNDLPGFSIGVT